ncbi:unnamed protein product, partial [Iphiclides podalirius]
MKNSLVALTLIASLSLNHATPTSPETDAAPTVTHATDAVDTEIETTPDPQLIIITTDPSAGKSSEATLKPYRFPDCLGFDNQVDPYFNPYFRLKMQDPLFRRWWENRKCPYSV